MQIYYIGGKKKTKYSKKEKEKERERERKDENDTPFSVDPGGTMQLNLDLTWLLIMPRQQPGLIIVNSHWRTLSKIIIILIIILIIIIMILILIIIRVRIIITIVLILLIIKKFVIFLRWALFRGRNVDRYENPC